MLNTIAPNLLECHFQSPFSSRVGNLERVVIFSFWHPYILLFFKKIHCLNAFKLALIMTQKELIKRIFSLQEQRVKVYKAFDR